MPNQPLQQWQIQGLKKATAAGNQAQYLQNHPGVQNRINFLQGGNPGQQARAGKLLGQPAAAAPAPQGSGGTGASKPSGGAAPSGGTTPATAPATQPAAAPAPSPTFSGSLTSQYGQGQPFDLQSWYGDNPIATGQAAATQNLQKNLADIRNTYGGGGMGTSAQEALAEGTATAQMNTQLGQYLSSLGQTARNNDVQNALNAFLGAGQQQLLGQQNQIAATTAGGNLGNMLNQIGALEQQIPNASLIANILGLFTQQQGQGVIQQTQQSGSGFLGM